MVLYEATGIKRFVQPPIIKFIDKKMESWHEKFHTIPKDVGMEIYWENS